MCIKVFIIFNLVLGYKGGFCFMLLYCVNGFKYVFLNVLFEILIGFFFSFWNSDIMLVRIFGIILVWLWLRLNL